jgi:D-sedoheptulose 7-phosphate isomerase
LRGCAPCIDATLGDANPEAGPLSEIARHIADHQRAVAALAAQSPLIERMAGAMIRCLAGGGCIYWLGNGGSAADCQHLAAELVGRFERERGGFASVALTTDSSVLTSVGNDYGFERIFARQVEALARPGDLVIGISTSGNSPNVLRALEMAATKGIATIGLSGRGGGALVDLADICLVVPDQNTARIQEAHILVGHILCDLVETHFGNAERGMRNGE